MDDGGRFDAFALAETDGLLRYATALGGDRELARDLVQDVLCKAYRRWELVAAAAQPRAYVRKMVTREYLSWRRRWASRNIVLLGGEFPEGPAAPDHAVIIADRDAMARRLAALPPRQRSVLVLRFYERLTDAEIAAELGCSAVTVRGYAARGLASLRRALQPTLTGTRHKP